MLLNEQQRDMFKEMINIGVGKSAALLNDMIEHPIKLSVPMLRVTKLETLLEEVGDEVDEISSVRLGFHGKISGVSEIFFPSESAVNLVALLTGEEGEAPEMDVLRSATLQEVANVLLNGVMGSIANLLEIKFEYDIPLYRESIMKNLLNDVVKANITVLYGETHFIVKSKNIEGDIIILLELPAFENLKRTIDMKIREYE